MDPMMEDFASPVELARMVMCEDLSSKEIAIINKFSCGLRARFEQSGDGSINDLHGAIELANIAVDFTPVRSRSRYRWLNNLGNLFGRRFEVIGAKADLEHAIEILDTTVSSMPQNHPDRACLSNSLSTWLGTRFAVTPYPSIDDLNNAVKFARTAVDLTPKGHNDRDRACWLNNLGIQLGTRFELVREMDDLKDAIKATDEAIKDGYSTPQGHAEQAARLHNLGYWLDDLYESSTDSVGSKSVDVLNRAIEVGKIAVDSTPQHHPDRACMLSSLGTMLFKRYMLPTEPGGLKADYNDAKSALKEGFDCRASPFMRIYVARKAVTLMCLHDNWQESNELLGRTIDLLPEVSTWSLKHTDKQDILSDLHGLASTAAAIALNARESPEYALDLLELGRGLIAGPLLEMRGDISDLKQQHPALADEFVSLRNTLDSPENQTVILNSPNTMLSWESKASKRRDAEQKLSKILTEIRNMPGFNNFLLPPNPEELMAAADPDPIVVINISFYRCDAFIVQKTQIRALCLPKLKFKHVNDWARYLRQPSTKESSQMKKLLEWLWDAVTQPILDALGFSKPVSDDNWPRIWWVPTGALSQLPLHAAGCYTRGSKETVLDRVMSSYASSIKSLIFGRRSHIHQKARPPPSHALLVAMEETPGYPKDKNLRYAQKEIDMLAELCKSFPLQPVRPVRYKKEVMEALQGCKIFHFAGHGESNPTNPLRSRLLLKDCETNPLTAGDLLDYKLQENPPFLGYLSACFTGSNTKDDLADEGIHLVSAFQLAGFRHVVGTLWGVSDKHCGDVARVLYDTLLREGMTDIAVCRGLHRALRELRAKHIDAEQKVGRLFNRGSGAPDNGLLDSHWIPYVHFGV